jgi:hypothetical protein
VISANMNPRIRYAQPSITELEVRYAMDACERPLHRFRRNESQKRHASDRI